MKVLLFNGSPRGKGCTNTALTVVAQALTEEGIECEILHAGNKPIGDCIACGGCIGKGKCAFDGDVVNEWIQKAATADGFVFGAPVYYAHPSGRMLSVMDRLFYAGGSNFRHKPGAVVTSARRAGATASLDALSKHLSINEMPIVTSSYWTMVHGNKPEEVLNDKEGLQTMRNLGKNMAWMLKCIQAGKAAGVPVPDTDRSVKTNFIRE